MFSNLKLKVKKFPVQSVKQYVFDTPQTSYTAGFKHRGEALFRNTCANGTIVNESSKHTGYLRGPRYNEKYRLNKTQLIHFIIKTNTDAGKQAIWKEFCKSPKPHEQIFAKKRKLMN